MRRACISPSDATRRTAADGDGGGGFGRATGEGTKVGTVVNKPLLNACVGVFPLIACVASSERRRYLSIFCLIGALIELF